ncbi:hypothetical protein [Deinococcus aestuarii]|uniref:hypothetical protein n=1 Tax=Deinococcus aestuarii TaxID=2774531 RepID=UPI001C0B86DB|nr:hypothetical protein [Deinococcus aestuarii]
MTPLTRLAAVTFLTSLSAALAASLKAPALPATPFCQAYHCALIGTVPIRPDFQLDLYTLQDASLAELRVWRDRDGVPGAAYVLHNPVDVTETKLPVIAQFLSAATGVPITPRDVRRAWSATEAEAREAEAAYTPVLVVHFMHGEMPYTLHVVRDFVETNRTPDWAHTFRLYKSQAIPQLFSVAPDPWGQKPVLSDLLEHQRAGYTLDRWLDLTPTQRAAFEKLVAQDAAFVQAGTPVGASIQMDPAAFNARLKTFLRTQDEQVRRLLGAQYPNFRAWVRTNWAGHQ